VPLPLIKMKFKLQIEYRWEDLKCKDGKLYLFPWKRGKVNRKTLETAGVYRWVKLIKRNGRKTKFPIYIGESGNLYNRIYGYLHHSKSQATNYRIGLVLRKLSRRHKIIFQVLTTEILKFAGKTIQNKDLKSMHLRQAIEQSLIFYEKRHRRCKLNKEK